MIKKIVFFANTSWYIYNFRMNIMNTLSDLKYKIIVIAPQDEYSSMIPYEIHHININNHGTNPFQDLVTYKKVYSLLKEISPDLILCYTIKPNIYGSLSAHFFGIPSIINIAGLGSMYRKKSIVSSFIRNFYGISTTKADFIFFQNKDDMKLFTEKYKYNRIKLLPGSGVDLIKFAPKKTEKNKRFTFLLLGRLLKEKGVYEFVESAKKVKEKYDVEFQLLGFIDAKNPIAIPEIEINKWHEMGIITYLGFTNDVRNFILKADCVVLPSYYGEGVPKSLLEAASMGKIIITTNHTGCKEVVEDGINGFICQPKDIDDLADKMILMLNLNEDEIKIMGKNGRKKIMKEFDEKIVIESYLKEISRLLDT